jgi:hypothetical protein
MERQPSRPLQKDMRLSGLRESNRPDLWDHRPVLRAPCARDGSHRYGLQDTSMRGVDEGQCRISILSFRSVIAAEATKMRKGQSAAADPLDIVERPGRMLGHG